ncbi:ribonuclease BN (tRNA processing enzyme) [Glaciihabitans tibetensis]|uniref:Ribonuclease BN (tRNA processing enzyme) n=1 Tax=Glaciihabitans tibetensis TaxID=1266600 RepID=A0A2T0V5Q0_9MICO|nr:MBL fold metallo-hydrolase [Glaciihabitans tibetensis]PRY65437.1 ribonuclease BN (tRNA processing enzyme) [Glaciihabitans tibetensis]
MLLTPLGVLAGMPASGQGSSGYLVHAGDTTILLDAGPGTALSASRHLDERALDAVFISHQHSDHIYDLLPLGKMLLSKRLRRDERTLELEIDESVAAVPLFVPRGALAALRTLAALFPVTTHPLLDRAFDLAFDVHEYEPGDTHTVGAASLRFELLAHVSPNCGVRVEAGTDSLVYTGDTGLTDALPALADGAGTLLSESTLRETDRSGHGHLTAQEAAQAARAAGVTDLVLTHFSSTDPIDHAWHRRSAAEIFAGPIHIAQPGLPLFVSPTRKASA